MGIDRAIVGDEIITQSQYRENQQLLLVVDYRQVAIRENRRESPVQYRTADLACSVLHVGQLRSSRQYGGGVIRTRAASGDGMCAQFQSVWRTIHNCPKFFSATMA